MITLTDTTHVCTFTFRMSVVNCKNADKCYAMSLQNILLAVLSQYTKKEKITRSSKILLDIL